MAPIILKEFTIQASLDTFLNKFWLDGSWYENFLVNELKDLSVQVEQWSKVSEDSSSKVRNVRSYHPSKISFPGLPSHAESLKVQTIDILKDQSGNKIVIKETNSFRGIPYSDYFNVNVEWLVRVKETNEKDIESSCIVTIYLDFQFLKSTWLQGTIESNTKAELVEVYELWKDSANEYLRRTIDRKQTLTLATSCDSVDINPVETGSPFSPLETKQSEYDPSGFLSDDEGFYDCEEGEMINLLGVRSISVSMSREQRSNYPGELGVSSNLRACTPPELHKLYGYPSKGQSGKEFAGTLALPDRSDSVDNSDIGSARDIAISVVETLFVLAEFTFWKLHGFYQQDMKDLFDIDLNSVLYRILNSFLPGWHTPVLVKPDLYGPLLAVFTLPQSLLIAMETSRHGCNPTSMLGNAVVITLFIWLGLSCLYRIMAMIIAPAVELRHCLSLVGYSFYAWNLALLCQYPLEIYKEYIDIPMLLPLVIFGIPSSIAQGCMFWEQTAASTMTLQPSALPTSFQHFATQHSRCLQKILWAFPKIAVFIVVVVTHYQFLWYMARVFLPGRRQLCELSALVKPSMYADILTQKELRKFAITLLTGKKRG